MIGIDQDEIAVECYWNEEFQRIVVNLNRIGQLTEGENADGEIIGTYSANTDMMSDGMTFSFEGLTFEKIEGEPYNFVDSGDFFRSFRLRIYNDGFTIEADDQKQDGKLTDKFGKNILGLNDENINEMVEKLIPLYIEETRKYIIG